MQDEVPPYWQGQGGGLSAGKGVHTHVHMYLLWEAAHGSARMGMAVNAPPGRAALRNSLTLTHDAHSK